MQGRPLYESSSISDIVHVFSQFIFLHVSLYVVPPSLLCCTNGPSRNLRLPHHKVPRRLHHLRPPSKRLAPHHTAQHVTRRPRHTINQSMLRSTSASSPPETSSLSDFAQMWLGSRYIHQFVFYLYRKAIVVISLQIETVCGQPPSSSYPTLYFLESS